MSFFADYRDHTGVDPARFFKTTIFQSPRLLLGMDCLEPGQSQPPHRHAGRDKFYYLIEGTGVFTIDAETRQLQPGEIAWAPADTIHQVVNNGTTRLVMLIGMAPEPG
ncbi:MAG TPA: cupin domain-containing protein [Roseiflexaceae bacterium]|nr:cupin domain-containing protein [Roseiflexaceae bacterium]HMP42333.1 cupin domain-containing protein [Roseiflexaceae bacterium]